MDSKEKLKKLLESLSNLVKTVSGINKEIENPGGSMTDEEKKLEEAKAAEAEAKKKATEEEDKKKEAEAAAKKKKEEEDKEAEAKKKKEEEAEAAKKAAEATATPDPTKITSNKPLDNSEEAKKTAQLAQQQKEIEEAEGKKKEEEAKKMEEEKKAKAELDKFAIDELKKAMSAEVIAKSDFSEAEKAIAAKNSPYDLVKLVTSLSNEVAGYREEKKKAEAAKVEADRWTELEKLGIAFVGDKAVAQKTKIGLMDDKAFASYKDEMVELKNTISSTAGMSEEELKAAREKAGKASASTEEPKTGKAAYEQLK